MKHLAVIFDLDGTVLDNEDEYGNAFKKVLESLGARVKKKYPHTGGIGVKENWPYLLKKYRIKTNKSLEELARQTQDSYLQQLDEVSLKPGFEEFARHLKDEGIARALATSNGRWIVEQIFDHLRLDSYFDVVTTGEEVTLRKPDPDLFLLTAQKLGFKPAECLVIEDAPSGVEAAHRAGMKVVGIARDDTYAKGLKDADRVVRGYNELLNK